MYRNDIWQLILQLVIGGFGLAAGLIGIAAYVDQRNDVNSICDTVSYFPFSDKAK